MLIGFLPVATILWSVLLRPEGRPSAPASGEPSPGDRASDLTATILAFAVFILTASRSLADPSGWHASAISILESFSGAERGVPELAAIAVVLGPLALAVIPLQVAAAVTGDHGGGHRGRTWVWVAAAALLAAGVVTVLLLAP